MQRLLEQEEYLVTAETTGGGTRNWRIRADDRDEAIKKIKNVNRNLPSDVKWTARIRKNMIGGSNMAYATDSERKKSRAHTVKSRIDIYTSRIENLENELETLARRYKDKNIDFESNEKVKFLKNRLNQAIASQERDIAEWESLKEHYVPVSHLIIERIINL